MKSLKKSVSVLLCVILALGVFGVVPFSVSAAATTWAALQTEINTTDIVTLSTDITAADEDKGIKIDSGRNVTLDLAGHTLSRDLNQSESSSGFVIKVSKGAVLTIKDSSGKNEGKITGGHSDNGGGIINEGTLRIEGGQICDNVASDHGGGILNKGTLNVSGGIIKNNVCKDGGGIYNEESGTLNLSGDAVISLNKTSDSGGGGVTNDGQMTVSENAQISINYANTHGGGICNNGTLTVKGGTITCNNATRAGSGIYNTGTLNMQGEPFVQNNIGDDIMLHTDKVITVTGAFGAKAQIGVTSPVEKAVVTKDYGKYNNNAPTDYFFENGENVKNVITENGEIKLNTEGLPFFERAWDKTTAAVKKTLKHLTSYTLVIDSLTEMSDSKWYVVQGNITVGSRVNCNGTANLLLCDGSAIDFVEGIRVESGMKSDLNIYGQQAGSGKLCAGNSGRHSAVGANEYNKNGTITILGGTIDLGRKGGLYTIGAAPHSAAGNYYIYGADVRCGDIGCGDYSETDTSAYIGIFNSRVRSNLHNGAGNLDIYNSEVNGGGAIYSSACIGGYTGCKQMGEISIYNSYVIATTQGNGAAIGSNKGCDSGKINIICSSVDARCTKDSVYKGGSSAAIGGGTDGNGGSIKIDHSYVSACATVGAGIGGGKNKNGGNITITESIILASSTTGGAGIGGGDDAHGGTISIDKSFVHCKTESKQDMGDYSGKNFEKALNSICFELMSKMTNGRDGTGSQIAYYHMGYLAGYFLTLAFAPDHGGAGIGGGDKGDSGTITITESEIIADGGKHAAGIGGGYKGGFNNITIGNSVITAKGGANAAGIGSGNKGSKTEKITITDSVVEARGGEDAAGIGGGNHSNGGIVEIISSTVKAFGDNYGSGIGGGNANDSATIRIRGNSTVTAVGGGVDESTGLGTGDYIFVKPDVTIALDDGLAVDAGNNESYSTTYYQNARYEPARTYTYVKVYPCEHKSTEYRCVDNEFHRMVCTLCGVGVENQHRHTFNEENICTVCKSTGTNAAVTFIEKNSKGDQLSSTEQKAKYSYYELPACKNTPENCEFIGWRDENDGSYYLPGDSVTVYGDATFTAVYLPMVEITFIDSDGETCTAKVRKLSADVPFLSSGQYAATDNIQFTQSVSTRGSVDLILADGVTVDLNADNRHPLSARSFSDFTLYGQKNQSGTLRLMSGSGSMDFVDLEMNGGRIETDRIVSGSNCANINRGTLIAKSLSSPKYLEIMGGTVKADNVTLTDCVLGWTEQTDSVQFDKITLVKDGAISIMDGLAFTDGTKVYENALDPDEIKGKKLTPYIVHHYDDPEWEWSDDHESATAIFRCTDEDCDEVSREDAEITTEETSDSTVYTAKVMFYGEKYTDTKTVKKETGRTVFTGHSLSLGGDIGVNFYLDLTEEEKENATVSFTWDVEGNEKSHTVSLKGEEKLSDGYKAACPIAVAEMTYDIHASITLDGVTYTDTYSAATYADVILDDGDFAETYVAAENEKGNNGAERLSDLRLLVKAMLDFGGKAQLQFDRKLSDLANKKLVTDDECSAYYYKPEAVTAAMINTGASNMSDVSAYGLRYNGSSIVFLSETSLRLYYKIENKEKFDQVVGSITFDGDKADYIVKDDEIYYELTDIAAADLDTRYTLKIGNTAYAYSVLDYVKACLSSDKTSDSMKTLAAATYRYNQAANVYFEK